MQRKSTPRLQGQLGDRPTRLTELVAAGGAVRSADLEEAQGQRIRFLTRRSPSEPQAGEIAEELANCRENAPCLSGACVYCGTSLQHAFARVTYGFLRDNFRRPKHLIVASLASFAHSAPSGDLHSLSAARVAGELKDALKEVGISLAIGGLDFSVEAPLDDLPLWQVTLWVFMPAVGRYEWEPTLREALPSKAHVRRPVWLRSYDGKRRATLYAVKTAFDRNERYIADNAHRDDRGPCQNTRKRPLKAAERLELLLHLHQEGLASRLFLHGVELKDGAVVKLVRAKP